MTRELYVRVIPDSRRLESFSAALESEPSSLPPFTADIIDDNEFETRLTDSPVPDAKSSICDSAVCDAASISEEEAKLA